MFPACTQACLSLQVAMVHSFCFKRHNVLLSASYQCIFNVIFKLSTKQTEGCSSLGGFFRMFQTVYQFFLMQFCDVIVESFTGSCCC